MDEPAAQRLPPRWPTRGWQALLILGLALLLAYAPGLNGPFLFDDFPNLLLNASMIAFRDHHGSLATILERANAGPLGRPLSVLSLALQAQWSGFVAWPFKLFNLTVHLLNAWLVYLLAGQLIAAAGAGADRSAPAPTATVLAESAGQQAEARSPAPRHAGAHAPERWALLAAAAWALHPLAVTSVLYVVQRMTSLSALGTLLALVLALRGRALLASGQSARWCLWLGFPLAGLVAVLSKESGFLLPGYLLVIEVTLLTRRSLPEAAARAWRRFIAVFVWLPVAAVMLTLPWSLPSIAAGYLHRDFSLGERLLTEARVVWFYARLVVLPDPRQLALFHDDLALSTGWLQPWTTLPAVIGLGGVVVSAVLLRRRAPWLAFAVLFFLVSQLLESSLVPLELVHEHRVYLGMLGPILAAIMGLRPLLAGLGARRPALLAALPVLLLGVVTGQRALDWSDPLTFVLVEAQHHPNSVRAQYELAGFYGDLAELSHDAATRQRLFGLAETHALHAIDIGPDEVKPRVGLLMVCAQSGCVPPPDTWSRLEAGLRSGHRTDLLASDVLSLAQCARDGVCRLPAGPMTALCDALAANPRLSPTGATLLAAARNLLAEAAHVADQGAPRPDASQPTGAAASAGTPPDLRRPPMGMPLPARLP